MSYLIDTSNILKHPVTWIGVYGVIAALLVTPVVNFILIRLRLMGPETRRDLWKRYFTWLVIAPVLVVVLLLCPLSAVLGVTGISLLCYREYARATGLFRERVLSAIVVVAMLLVAFASVDSWFRLFVGLPALAITVLAAAAVLKDEPKGFIQRVSIAGVGFLLLGAGLGHLGFIANDPSFRPILVLLVASSQLSDIAGYCVGRTIGKKPLFPNTSPNKTIAGHLGSLLIVAPLSAYAAHVVFQGSPLDRPLHLAGLGVIIAVGAQLGDLVMGSIKRDLGLKDMAATLPGHGGFLDRFNSLLLIAPAAFYYVNYLGGFHFPDVPHRLFGQTP